MEYVEEINLILLETEKDAKTFSNGLDHFVIAELNASSNPPNYFIKPDSLTILIVTDGHIHLTFDQQPTAMGTNSVIRTLPEHPIRFEGVSTDFQGKVISVNRDVLNLTTTGFSPNTYLYIRQHPILELTDIEMEEVLELFYLINKKFRNISTIAEEKVFHCLIMALYFELMGSTNKRIKEKPQITLSHKENLYKKFLVLLRDNVQKEHSVTFYANELCLTPQYISSVLKELSGMTANKWIDEMLLAEAKRMLFSTENNIQQIADYLNFPDQSSFGKFFKKMTGTSPSNYKRQKLT